MKLQFIQDAIYNGEIKYKKGEVVDIDNKLGEADRWIKRAVAVDPTDISETKEQPKNKYSKVNQNKPKVIVEKNNSDETVVTDSDKNDAIKFL
jgi:hypothetical protein